MIAGTSFDRHDVSHGFVRDRDGSITTDDVPGSVSTMAYTINPRGVIAGSFSDASGVSHGFLRIP
jgi:hypothetical protein